MGQVLLTGGNNARRGVILLEGKCCYIQVYQFLNFVNNYSLETRFFSLWTVADLRELKKKVII